MNIQTLQQYAFFTVMGGVALLTLWYIFIKAPRERLTEFAGWAQRRGLRFTPPIFLGSAQQGIEVSVLDGAFQGVGFQLKSHRLVNSRRAGINGHADIELRAMVPAPASFTMVFEPGPSVQAPDAVWTGDNMFDGRIKTRSDDPAAARAWLAFPPVRQAIAEMAQDGTPFSIRYEQGLVAFRLPRPIWEERMLDRALAAVQAAAHARLG